MRSRSKSRHASRVRSSSFVTKGMGTIHENVITGLNRCKTYGSQPPQSSFLMLPPDHPHLLLLLFHWFPPLQLLLLLLLPPDHPHLLLLLLLPPDQFHLLLLLLLPPSHLSPPQLSSNQVGDAVGLSVSSFGGQQTLENSSGAQFLSHHLGSPVTQLTLPPSLMTQPPTHGLLTTILKFIHPVASDS